MRRFGKIDGISVMITDHALTRMTEMGVTPEEFKNLLSDPEETYTSQKYPDAKCHRRDKFAMALKLENQCLIVITMLYATLEDWCDAAREGLLGDRKLKMGTGIPQRRRK